MNKLNRQKQAQIVAALIEGNSIRATARMCDADKETVMKLQLEAGFKSAEYQDKVMQGLTCKRVQCDEIWAFCYAKDKNLPADLRRSPKMTHLCSAKVAHTKNTIWRSAGA